MKKLLLVLPLAGLVLFNSCKKEPDDPIIQPPPVTDTTRGPDISSYAPASISRTTTNKSAYREPANNELKGDIIDNTILKTGKTYTMNGFVYVRHGATLPAPTALLTVQMAFRKLKVA
jgi:hypothetical protein